MTINEAKKILLAADLDPLVREALNVLSPELECVFTVKKWYDKQHYERKI